MREGVATSAFHDRLGRLAEGLGSRRAVLWAPVAFGGGVQMYFLARVEPLLWSALLGAALSVAVAAAAWPKGGVARFAAIAVALSALGFAAASLRAHVVAAPVLDAEVDAAVEGTILRIDQSRAGLPRLLLGAPRIYGLRAEATPARLRATLRSARYAEGLRPGDRVSVLARLGPPGGPVEPGGFDFRRFAWFDRLGAVGLARGPVAVIARGEARALDGLRFDLGETLRARLPGERGAFLAALTVGDRSGLPPDALQALRDANLAHLLAISGLHMSIVCGLAFFSIRLALALVPGLALRWPLKKIAAAGGLVVGLGYLALSGASVATERAFIMVAVALCAVLLDRPAVTLRALAVAALIVLARAPESLTEVGFQMSFAATLALVSTYEFVRARRGAFAPQGLVRRFAVYLGALVLTSLVAGLATAPFAAFHFNRVTFYGLPANLAATPVLGLIVAPALCLAGLAAPFGLHGPFLEAAGSGVAWILAVARWIAALPSATSPVAAAPVAALWAITAGGLVLCLCLQPAMRAFAGALLVCGAILWLAGVPRPELLIAADGRPVGLMTQNGRLPIEPTRSIYAVESWLRRDGDGVDWREAATRTGAWRNGPWIDAVGAKGLRVAVFTGERADLAGARRRCMGGAVVVIAGFSWPRQALTAGDRRLLRTGEDAARAPHAPIDPAKVSADGMDCLVFDRGRLREEGAIAVHLTSGGTVRVEAADRDLRIWSRR